MNLVKIVENVMISMTVEQELLIIPIEHFIPAQSGVSRCRTRGLSCRWRVGID